MPDCSKTAEFLAAWNRMHKAAKGACGICPMKDVCEDVGRIKEKGQTIVQKWADENPIKTYADVLFEKFPNFERDGNGIPNVCKRRVFNGDTNCRQCVKEVGVAECSDIWNMPAEEEG